MKKQKNAKNHAFTLAEAMITLVIVGIVAAVTVPTLMHRYSQRVNSERHADIVYKMANAMHMMKVQGELYGKFATTMDFVNRLKKYIKIDRICDSEHIAECWPTKTVITRSGGKYNVSNAKTRADILGNKTNGGHNPNVGIILADGASLILSYNPEYEGLEIGERTEYSAGLLPVGGGLEEFKEYSNNTMEGISFLFDVNGNGGPNKEKVGLAGSEHRDILDIRGFHGARFDAKNVPGFGCADFVDYGHYETSDGTCYFRSLGNMNWETAMSYECPDGAINLSATMNQNTLGGLCETLYTELGRRPSGLSGLFWSSQSIDVKSAYHVYFSPNGCIYGSSTSHSKTYNIRIMCKN